MSTNNVDAADQGSDGGKEAIPVQEWNFYLRDYKNTFKIIETKWGTFVLLGGFVYLYHLMWTIAGVNAYADYTREKVCGDPVAKDGDEASAIFDSAIAIATIYHMIEWVRWTLLLTSALVSVNLVGLFNILGVNWIVGLVSLIITQASRYSQHGNHCATETLQPTRALYLALQPICFVLSFFFTFAAHIFMRLRGKDWVHEQFIAEPEEDDD